MLYHQLVSNSAVNLLLNKNRLHDPGVSEIKTII